MTNNLVFDYMKVMAHGGGIYTNGQQGASLDDAELITDNVVLHQPNLSWAVYTDNGSENVTIRTNVVYEVFRSGRPFLVSSPSSPLVVAAADRWRNPGTGRSSRTRRRGCWARCRRVAGIRSLW